MTVTLIICNILLCVVAVIGMYYNAQKNKTAFIINSLGLIPAIYIGYVTDNYGIVISSIVYLVMYTYSYIKWSKK